MKAILAPAARRDLVSAVQWIARDNPVAARGLRDAVVRVTETLGAHPEIGMVRPELAEPPTRFLSLTGFPYILVYDSGRRPPRIIRILHGARDLPEVLAAH